MGKNIFIYVAATSYIVGFYLIFTDQKNAFLTKLGYALVILNMIIMAYYLLRRRGSTNGSQKKN